MEWSLELSLNSYQEILEHPKETLSTLPLITKGDDSELLPGLEQMTSPKAKSKALTNTCVLSRGTLLMVTSRPELFLLLNLLLKVYCLTILYFLITLFCSNQMWSSPILFFNFTIIIINFTKKENKTQF